MVCRSLAPPANLGDIRIASLPVLPTFRSLFMFFTCFRRGTIAPAIIHIIRKPVAEPIVILADFLFRGASIKVWAGYVKPAFYFVGWFCCTMLCPPADACIPLQGLQTLLPHDFMIKKKAKFVCFYCNNKFPNPYFSLDILLGLNYYPDCSKKMQK